MQMERGKRVLYIIGVAGCDKYFKVGTWKLNFMQKLNPNGPAVFDRYSGRPTPPGGLPADLIWDVDKLYLIKSCYTGEPDVGAADDPINTRLRQAAKDCGFLKLNGEFHDMRLLGLTMYLMDQAECNTDKVSAPTPAVKIDLSPADLRYNVYANEGGWKECVPTHDERMHNKDMSTKVGDPAVCAAIEWCASAASGAASGSSAPSGSARAAGIGSLCHSGSCEDPVHCRSASEEGCEEEGCGSAEGPGRGRR